ncbi:hypothetical protein CHL76_02355 [Marinococcus halophilus]|uniref:dUTP diphosphatase n=1 Tax=Marinococcus halophilus TaxID=1371 RepID=A0A510Y1U3_MARHA|nr:dUTP diphosphatase [Marinococcus halophilus]OZT81218.1 hypothetical protein CHL76_02355 [Marinococcus halophilus]GEK57153.1 deoxyuridine 5'-triphosphate nucleotidohydrolase [Marinococcus halophilus]
MKVQIKKLHEDAIVPTQNFEKDVGVDVSTVEEGTLQPNERKVFKLGLAFKPERGYEMQIRPRSGIASKKGVTVLNSPATIEPTFRGNVGVLLYNAGSEPFHVKKGSRIAQAVFKEYEENVDVEVVDDLDETSRGSKGWGSSKM